MMQFDQLNRPLFEDWQQYQHPLVRQLAFAIGSPNILTTLPDGVAPTHLFAFHDDYIWQQHLNNYAPRLRALEQNPEPLEQFLAQLKSTRLGLRFEMLIWFWLLDHEYHSYRLLGHSIQIIDGPRTIGELDFLLFNTQTNQVEHWEVALKYYLGEADLSLPHWYGLNRSDTLNRKLQHFSQKQFQFAEALDHPIEKRMCVLKGQLYLPIHHSTFNIPKWVNTQRRLGLWGTQIPNDQKQFYRLQRHEWIYPQASPSAEDNVWWTDGLYKQKDRADFYMYRQACLLNYAITPNLSEINYIP